jgi:hypothetical protein
MPVTHDSELEAFKTAIDLRAYAAALGYSLDRRESWRGSSVLRQGSGDKIIVKKDHDQHYVYFSVRDEQDNGSIIDFAMRRKSLNLGQVRKELRPWIGKDAASLPAFPLLPVSTKDRFEVDSALRRMVDASRHLYLEDERRVPAALLEANRFAGRIKRDGFGNAVFPHFDLEGLCGYEIKNRGFTGFARGGEKGLWLSHREDGDNRLVLAESAIDALSHAALFPAPGTRYASIGGEMNPRQPDLLLAALRRLPAGSEVVAAMDADETGQKLCGAILEAVERSAMETGRKALLFTPHSPHGAKDWNDVLRLAPKSSFPTALFEPR